MLKNIALFSFLGLARSVCSSYLATLDDPDCCDSLTDCPNSWPNVYNSLNLDNLGAFSCPVTSAVSTTYTRDYNDCISSFAFYSCVWDGWNAIQITTNATLANFRYAYSTALCEQVECDAYALWADCLQSANTASACLRDFSPCLAEWCKPTTTYGTSQDGTSCLADSECAGGSCSSFGTTPGTCRTPWTGNICYDRYLTAGDSAQWAGCLASATGSFTGALPQRTWRSLRDSPDAQKAFCDDNRGMMDTQAYVKTRVCPLTTVWTPEELAYSDPFCHVYGITGDVSVVESDVVEEYFNQECTMAGNLISISNDNEITVDQLTKDACYSARDNMNSLGIALDEKCFAECDPDSSSHLVLSLLMSLFFF